MRILVCGHSMASPRQQRFWEYFASLGHDVLLLAPVNWGYPVVDVQSGSFTVKAVGYIGVGRRVRGFLEAVEEFKPEWIYLNDEQDAGQILQACQMKKDYRLALFSWENRPNHYEWEKLIDRFDLFIPGSPGARKMLINKGVPQSRLSDNIPQVGIDTELFTPMPENTKFFDTITVSRWADNKGVCEIQKVVKELKLNHLWLGRGEPSCQITYGEKGWVDYEKLPYFYNKARVHVLFSRDEKYWTEQFAPFANIEALSCGLSVVTSAAGEIPHFLKDCPQVRIVPQNDVAALKDGIEKELSTGHQYAGREFVIENFGYEKITKDMVRVFE